MLGDLADYQLGNLCRPGLSHGLTCGAGCPRVTVRDRSSPGVNGPLMARWTAVRPALMAAPWSSPVLLDSCRPSGRARRVKAREAAACGLALTRRTRPRQSSSEEDARRLHSLRPEAGMPDVALPEKRKVDSSILSLTTTRSSRFSGAYFHVWV